jgi:hypothetical protein
MNMKAHPIITASLLLLALLMGSISLLSAQKIERSVSPFDEVVAFGNVEVILMEGEEHEVRFKAYNVPNDKVITESSGGKLSLKLHGIYDKDEYAVFYVTSPRYREIKSQAGARIESKDVLHGDKISLSAFAGGQMLVSLSTEVAEARAGEGGKLELEGRVNTLHATANNGGELDSYELQAQTVFARANLGGVARVLALDTIEASAKAGGRVVFAGDPPHQNTSTALGGAVIASGEEGE